MDLTESAKHNTDDDFIVMQNSQRQTRGWHLHQCFKISSKPNKIPLDGKEDNNRCSIHKNETLWYNEISRVSPRNNPYQCLDLKRRGLLVNNRPLARTNTAMPRLRPAQTSASNKWRPSFGAAKEDTQRQMV